MTWARGVRTIGRREVRKPKDSNLAGEAHGLDRLHEDPAHARHGEWMKQVAN